MTTNKETKKQERQREYNLRATEDHAQIMHEALDFYARIKIGQISEVVTMLTFSGSTMLRNVPNQNIDEARQLLDRVARLLFPELAPGASYGIGGSPDEKEKIAFEMRSVIRQRLALDRLKPGEKPGFSVDFHEPLKVSKAPLITVEQVPPKED